MAEIEKKAERWYLRTSVLVIAFLCVGPFAMILVWMNPKTSLRKKFVFSLIISILTYLSFIAMNALMKPVIEWYNLMLS